MSTRVLSIVGALIACAAGVGAFLAFRPTSTAPRAGEPLSDLATDPEPSPKRPPAPISAELLDAPPLPASLDAADPLIADAVRAAAERVRADPDAAWAWDDLARTYHANNINDLAANCYEQVLLRDPANAKAAYLLALVRYATGDTAQAIELLDHAIAVGPTYAPAHWRAGLWLIDENDLDRADARLATALQVDPRSEAATFGLARVRLLQGRTDESIGLLESIAEPRNRAYQAQLLAAAYRRAGDPQRAAEVLAGVPPTLPVWPDPWLQEVSERQTGFYGQMQRAERLVDQGRFAEAVEALRRLDETHPEEEILHINLAHALSGLGRRDEALDTLRAILDFKPDSYLAHQSLGAVLLTDLQRATGSGADPEPNLLAALEINPRDVRSRMLLGDLHVLREQPVEALEAYEAALDVDPRNVQVLDRIGTLHTRAQRFEEALDAFERLVAIEPRAVPIWGRVAALRLRLGRPDDAQAALDQIKRLAPDATRQIAAMQRQIDQARARQDNGDG